MNGGRQNGVVVVFDVDDLAGVVSQVHKQSTITESSHINKSQTVQRYQGEKLSLLREHVFRRIISLVSHLSASVVPTSNGFCYALCIARDPFLVQHLRKAFMWELDARYFESRLRPKNVQVTDTYTATDSGGDAVPCGRVVSQSPISAGQSVLMTFRAFFESTGSVSIGISRPGILH